VQTDELLKRWCVPHPLGSVLLGIADRIAETVVCLRSLSGFSLGIDGQIAETVVCPPAPSPVFVSGLRNELLKRWCVPTIPAARELKRTAQEIVDDSRERRPVGVWSVFL
jgi:hypothetical protein